MERRRGRPIVCWPHGHARIHSSPSSARERDETSERYRANGAVDRSGPRRGGRSVAAVASGSPRSTRAWSTRGLGFTVKSESAAYNSSRVVSNYRRRRRRKQIYIYTYIKVLSIVFSLTHSLSLSYILSISSFLSVTLSLSTRGSAMALARRTPNGSNTRHRTLLLSSSASSSRQRPFPPRTLIGFHFLVRRLHFFPHNPPSTP